MISFLKFLRSIAFPLILLSGCGGGGGGDVEGPPNTTAVVSDPRSMSARLLPDNTVQLTLEALQNSPVRFCIRQDAATPAVSDACFSDSPTLSLVQTQTIANPSSTQRAVFTAWVLSGDTVRRHAILSVPGRTCSTAAYTALQAAASNLPAVCVLTGANTNGVTNLYESVLLLESVKAPISVGNFLRYVNQGFYDQTVFHRFLKIGVSVVQGGGFQLNGTTYQSKPPTQAAIPLESTIASGLSNSAGTIAMARTDEPDSGTSQFFVNTTNNPSFNSSNLRNGYAVFGRFIYGSSSWGELLNAVPNTSFTANDGGAVNPATPVHLHWAYQIQ
jgi:cyclophilin family peptidyl-prolyl cis-trans isomerase